MAEENFKIWQATKDSKAAFMVTDDTAYLIGTPKNFIAASDTGVTIVGKSISLAASGEQRREGGLFVKLPDPVRMVPSSMVTPLPPQIPFPPLGMVFNLLTDLPFFIAMVAVALVPEGKK